MSSPCVRYHPVKSHCDVRVSHISLIVSRWVSLATAARRLPPASACDTGVQQPAEAIGWDQMMESPTVHSHPGHHGQHRLCDADDPRIKSLRTGKMLNLVVCEGMVGPDSMMVMEKKNLKE